MLLFLVADRGEFGAFMTRDDERNYENCAINCRMPRPMFSRHYSSFSIGFITFSECDRGFLVKKKSIESHLTGEFKQNVC